MNTVLHTSVTDKGSAWVDLNLEPQKSSVEEGVMPFETARNSKTPLGVKLLDRGKAVHRIVQELFGPEPRNPIGHFCSLSRMPQRSHTVRFWMSLIDMVGSLMLCGAMSALAQAGAIISGTVVDPSGAVIAGATVEVTNQNTQVTKRTVTNTTGYYQIQDLIPGTYSISVEMTGFKKAVRSNLPIQVAQSAQVNFTLQLGQVSQSIQVSGAPPLLQTRTAEVGQVVNSQEVTQLPLNDRNYLRLALLAPGTSGNYNRTFFNSALTDNIGSVNAGSTGEDRNAFILDGADVKAYLINMSFVPSIDAIQEFKIETTPYDVSLGTNPGAQIIMTTRSGTDQYHGTVWEYLRNNATDARDFFAPTTPELRKNQFGYTFGGPIKKDHLFFFTNNEFFRERVGETFFGTVPTVLMRQGDFSETGRAIFNPLSTAPCTSCPSGFTRTPFPNNTIPASLMNSAAVALLNLWPVPTGSGIVNGIFVGNNFSALSVDKVTRNHGNYRLDWDAPNGKDTVFGRFSFNNSTLDLAKGVFGTASLPGFGDNFILNQRNLELHETHTFSPTTVLDAMASYYRVFPNISPKQLGNALNQKLGIQGVRQNEPPDISISGFAAPYSNPFAPEYDLTNQYQYVLDLTKIIERHTLKLGAGYDRWQFFENHAPRFPMGLYSFNGSLTKDPNNLAPTGFSFADFLLGFPTSGQTISGDDSGLWFRNNFRWYVGDEWRATPNLTLNLGVRWEYDGPPYEKYNRLANFNLATGTILLAGTDLPFLSGGPEFHGLPVKVGNRSPFNRDLDNYNPRFGFAYRLRGHPSTVIRGGYGIFSDVVQMNILNDTRANFPFVNFPNLVVVNAPEVVPAATIQNAFAPGVGSQTKPNFKAEDLNLQNGYLQQASFSIEHQFATNYLFSIGYNWQKTTSFMDQPPANQPLQNGTFIRPYPLFNSITLLTNDEYGHYSALLAKLEKRFSGGLTLLTSFTWSKNLDDDSSGAASVGAPGQGGFQNPYCMRCEFGRSSMDYERRFVQSWVYDLPTPRRLGNGHLVQNTIGGWELSGIITLQSGFPITPNISFDNSESLNFADRPNLLLGVPFFPAGTRTPNRWFNPAAFAVAPPGHYGNAGRDIIEGPGIFTWDLGLMKNFSLTERTKLQFRGEFFNITNHPNFGTPDALVDTPEAGIISSTTTNPRQMQFALRLSF
jgi:hypothetical protein